MIATCGDLHGDIDFHTVSNTRMRKRFGVLPNYLIACGDFGVPWSNNPDDPRDAYLTKWYGDKPYDIIVCPGNHENYNRISQMPKESYMGGTVRRFSKNIVFVEKNEILTIEGKVFFFFGGATSIDKGYRTPYISWWPEEDATYGDHRRAIDVMADNPIVDYVISHTCPESIVGEFTKGFEGCDDACPTRRVLDYIAHNLNFSKWYFGHFHRDKSFDKYTCVYREVHQV